MFWTWNLHSVKTERLLPDLAALDVSFVIVSPPKNSQPSYLGLPPGLHFLSDHQNLALSAQFGFVFFTSRPLSQGGAGSAFLSS